MRVSVSLSAPPHQITCLPPNATHARKHEHVPARVEFCRSTKCMRLPPRKKRDRMNEVIAHEHMASSVFTTATSCPSPATAELNEGQYTHRNSVPRKLNTSVV